MSDPDEPREQTSDSGEPDRQALLTVLTTEHFTLQGARSNTVSESTARTALYVGASSASLVALGLLAQATNRDSAFAIFLLVVLPTLYAVGTFTFVRVSESSIEDLAYGRAINRIRAYYRELAGAQSRYLALGGNDDVAGVLANMGITRPSRWQLYFTLASMVAMLNGVVGGSAVAFATDKLGAPIGAASGVGAAFGLVSIAMSLRWQRRLHDRASAAAEVLFPSQPRSPANE
jgi:hypothetical protein